MAVLFLTIDYFIFVLLKPATMCGLVWIEQIRQALWNQPAICWTFHPSTVCAMPPNVDFTLHNLWTITQYRGWDQCAYCWFWNRHVCVRPLNLCNVTQTRLWGQWAWNFHVRPTFSHYTQQVSAPARMYYIKKHCDHIGWLSISPSHYLYAVSSLLRLYSIINLIYFLKNSHSHCLQGSWMIRFLELNAVMAQPLT